MTTVELMELLDGMRIRLGDEYMLHELASSLSTGELKEILNYIAKNNYLSPPLRGTIGVADSLEEMSLALGDRYMLYELYNYLSTDELEEHLKNIADHHDLSNLYAS